LLRPSMHVAVLMIFSLFSSCFHKERLQGTEEKQKPVALGLTCSTIVQAPTVAPNDVWLTADVPKGATDLHPVFAVKRPPETNPWVPCSPGTTCNGVALPDMSHPGADSDDAALHYALYLSPAPLGAYLAPAPVVAGIVQMQFPSLPPFYSPRWVRLISQYTMTSAVCASQSSFEVASNADSPLIHMAVPPGKSITRITTYMRELSAGNHWVQHDDWVNPAPGNVAGAPSNMLRFFYRTMPADQADHAQSVLVGCVNRVVNGDLTISSPNRRGCRVRLEY
jgi:hypothetical protein